MKRNLLKKRCFEKIWPAIVDVLGHNDPTFDCEREARELRAELATMSDETLHRMLENIQTIENGGVGDLEEDPELLKKRIYN